MCVEYNRPTTEEFTMRMRRNMLDTSNPALKNPDIWDAGLTAEGSETASVQGVVNKTGMLTVICVIGGMLGI